MSPDDHLLTNRKQSLIRSKQTPDPSVQFLVNKGNSKITEPRTILQRESQNS